MNRLDEIRARDAEVVTFSLSANRFSDRELQAWVDLQQEVSQVCRDRAYLLDLVERAVPLLLTHLNRGAGKDGPSIEQWLTDAGYGEGEG